ncbi:MAG: glycosyltransferase [Acidobacteria bacterium]|nr:glycosyltransferase [Acidobacteriota bacterium]
MTRDSDVRVVTNGQALYEILDQPCGTVAVSATLREGDFGCVQRLRPADAPFRILFVGYLRHEKGLDLLLETYRTVLLSRPDAELVVVGNQPLTDRKAEAQFLRGAGLLPGRARVELKGYVPFGTRLFQEYADADVLVLPSRSEGTPRVLVEARAFGCPVVATNVGGVSSSVSDGIDGLLVESGDVRGLVRSVLSVADQPELRRRLVIGGLARARSSTVEAFVDTLVEQVRQVMAQRSPASTEGEDAA